MNWREILKESSPKLRQENIVTTIEGGEPEPEREDDRCKKKLEQLLKDLDKRMRQDDITGSPNMYFKGILSWEGNLDNMLAELRDIPEETCCEILEGFRKISSGEYVQLKFQHRGDVLYQNIHHALTVQQKQMFHEVEKFAHPDSILDYLESPLFFVGFNRFLIKYTGAFELKVHQDMINAYKLRGKEEMYSGQKDLLRVLDDKWQLAHETILEVVL